MKSLDKDKVILWLIVLIVPAIVTRFLLIGEGLPAVYNSTEKFIAKNTLIMASEKNVTPPQAVYPTLYSFVLSGTWGGLYIFERVTGSIQSVEDFAEQFLVKPDLFYISGRVLTVLFFLMIMLVGGLFLKKYYSLTHGITFGAVLIFSNVFVYHSFRILPDVLLMLLGLCATICFYQYYQNGRNAELFAGAILTGFTIGSKYNAAFLIAVPLILIWFGQGRAIRQKVNASIYVISLVLLAFFISTPGWVVNFRVFWDGFMSVLQQNYMIGNRNESFFSSNILFEWAKKDFWLLVIVMAGWISGLRHAKINLFDKAILFFIALTFIVVLSFQKRTIDYVFLPVLLFYFLGIRHLEIKRLSYFLFICFFLMAGGVSNLWLIRHSLEPDSRAQLVEWLKKQNPDGRMKILYDHYHMDLPVIDIDLFLNRGSYRKNLSHSLRNRLMNHQRSRKNMAVYQWSYRVNTPQWPHNWDSKTIERFSQNSFLQSQLSFQLYSPDSLSKMGVQYLVLNSQEIHERLSVDTTLISPDDPFRDFTIAYYRIYSQIMSHPADTVFQAGHRWEEPDLYVYHMDSLNVY